MKNRNILLWPFLIIISFIKHVFIGIKFVFFDVWKNWFDYVKNKKRFNKIEKESIIVTPDPEEPEKVKKAEPEEQHVISYNERQRIASEKKELIAQMQKEINVRKVNKEYYHYYGTKDGQKLEGTMSATNKITLHNFLASEGIDVYSIKKAGFPNFLKKIGLDNEKEMS